MHSILTIPQHIEQPLTEYANAVLENPGKYTSLTKLNELLSGIGRISQTDPSVPGTSDEFIRTWDLNSIHWGGFNLQTTKCEQLSKISFPPMSISVPLIEWLESTLKKRIIRPTGNFLYPKGGFMGWHTNGNMPGIRVYLAYSPTTNGSYFKYVDRSNNNTIVTDWDNQGWTARVFEVSHNPNDFYWHCVDAPNAPRISFGYWFN